MHITIHGVIPSDLETISEIQFAALLPVTPIERLIYPSGMTANSILASITEKQRRFHEPNVKYLKAVTERGQILSFARWYTLDHDKPYEGSGSAFTFRPSQQLEPEDMNVETARSFYQGIDELKKRNIAGKPCLYLSLIATHPNYQGLGAGSQLLDWGIKYATEHGLDIYAVSTAASLAWYEKFGFRSVDKFSIDMACMGGKDENNTLGLYTATLIQFTVAK
ncbi:hypothetical protein SNK05_012929 [Fusarium graminearum]|uniref:Chromosome 3, complete genome n=1 Tax=Gibberella zeae (strain ATCC MYA-4620 / CBS 123657 / FGSC 9075 / NRRL 31084 / PH-1) TaxID=229533 RepID=A0A098E3M2_GIBZE|nr:unnamed protein product [Fusarium graminearum]CEF88224.1 unnamed protein product [Fusarium graminearum]